MIITRKIQGIDNLLCYLESAELPLSKERVELLLSDKQLPHVRYGQVVIFYEDHIDWWIRQQKRKATQK